MRMPKLKHYPSGQGYNLFKCRRTSGMTRAGLLTCLLVVSSAAVQVVGSWRATPSDRKLQLVNSPDVSFLSPRSPERTQPQRGKQATVVNDLVARISSALAAVSGDDQAVTIQDATTSPPPTTQATQAQQPTVNTTFVDNEKLPVTGSTEQPGTTTEEDCCSDDLGEDLARNMTDNERLVALQDSLQKEVRRRLKSSMRGSMEMFERVTLSGGCSSSLMSLMSNLGELKSFAFKFIDASAKIPSGVMYGLLSDFGDFDQCLSIRSNREVPPEQESLDSGGYSGKYCLFNVRLNYHVQLGPNASAPEGIYEDGVLWDELMRNYWTSNSTKGFQVGVCVPSRCTNEDLEQLYKTVAESYNVLGDVISCQDSNDVMSQTSPDLLQMIILSTFIFIVLINLVATFVERYTAANDTEKYTTLRVLLCFSLRRNWNLFMRHRDGQISLEHDKKETTQDIQAREGTIIPEERIDRSIYCSSLASKNSQTQTTITETIISSSNSSNSLQSMSQDTLDKKESEQAASDYTKPLSIRIDYEIPNEEYLKLRKQTKVRGDSSTEPLDDDNLLSHLSGLKLFVIIWITIGHSFLYPSANNYQYYRSIINMNITRDSVWFASTNFTLGIDMLLYMAGLVFVYKMIHIRQLLIKENCISFTTTRTTSKPLNDLMRNKSIKSSEYLDDCPKFGYDFAKKIIRFWPTYSTVVALAIVIPLFGTGPMWPEMVSHRLGESCRKNWWANLLLVNNLSAQADICLPSSWFVSVLMQLLLLGSIIMLVLRRYSITLAIYTISFLILSSSAVSFAFAYIGDLKAPAIRMDESFVLELDGQIFRLYTNLFNNMGPFMVGMLGGLFLIRWRVQQMNKAKFSPDDEEKKSASTKTHVISHSEISNSIMELLIYLLMASIATAVLSSVFHSRYTRFWAAIYWSCHRIGWAIVTGFLIHNCAIGKWKLLKDIFSLSHLIPLSRLIFIAYLVYPIFIHIHSGLVRDGLHVSVYNMMNIYVTRLVLTFVLAMMIHLMVEAPIYSMVNLLSFSPHKRHKEDTNSTEKTSNRNMQPLLTETKISE